MYRETITRNRAQVIVVMILAVVLALYIEQAIEFTEYKSKQVFSPIDSVLIGITSIFIIYEIITCKIYYKYSLIADKLIVNRTIFTSEKNLISIKKSDIVYVGKNKNLPRDLRVKSLGKYTCNIFGSNTNVCVFKNDEQYYKFKFSPSDRLMNKLKVS